MLKEPTLGTGSLASTRINIEVKLGFDCGCPSQLKSPTTSGITHRHVDRHPTLIGLMLGLPLCQRHNVIGFAHAKHVVIGVGLSD